MHNGFHRKSNVDRWYLPTSESSRGLMEVRNTVRPAILGLNNYIRNNKERLLTAAHTIKEDKDRETLNEYENWKKNKREKQGTQKQ